MLLPLERLIDGCMETLREDVLHHMESGFARGQVYAVIDVLNNMRDRIEERATIFASESESAVTALEGVAAALRAEDCEAEARIVDEALATAPEEPPRERTEALRQALSRAMETLYSLPSGVPEAARQALAAHLGAQAIRDTSLLKPSLLKEMSKG